MCDHVRSGGYGVLIAHQYFFLLAKLFFPPSLLMLAPAVIFNNRNIILLDKSVTRCSNFVIECSHLNSNYSSFKKKRNKHEAVTCTLFFEIKTKCWVSLRFEASVASMLTYIDLYRIGVRHPRSRVTGL